MKEDILLVHLPDTPLDGSKPVFTPPLGLWSMRTNNFGKDVRVWDAGIHSLPLGLHHATIGFSLQFPAHERYLRSNPGVLSANRLVVGGPTGGKASLSGFESIPGSGESWLAGRHVPFADLLPPRFGLSEMFAYWDRGAPFSGLPPTRRWMPVETSRGCPNACGFCAIPALWGAWQERPLAMLDEYFAYLRGEHAIQEIIVVDDNVAARVERFLAIIELFKKYGFAWSIANGIYNRALLHAEVREAIRDSKCLYMSLPFEAGNQRSADLMQLGKKYLSYEEALFLTQELAKLHVHTAGQFIIGYPGETEEDVCATLAYANSLLLNQRHIHLATPLPGTPMHETCVKNNYLVGELADGTYKTPLIETPWLSRQRLYTIWQEDRAKALRRKA